METGCYPLSLDLQHRLTAAGVLIASQDTLLAIQVTRRFLLKPRVMSVKTRRRFGQVLYNKFHVYVSTGLTAALPMWRIIES